jgi:hypothetical protein
VTALALNHDHGEEAEEYTYQRKLGHRRLPVCAGAYRLFLALDMALKNDTLEVDGPQFLCVLAALRLHTTSYDVPPNGYYKTPPAGTNAMTHLGAPKGESDQADKIVLATVSDQTG